MSRAPAERARWSDGGRWLLKRQTVRGSLQNQQLARRACSSLDGRRLFSLASPKSGVRKQAFFPAGKLIDARGAALASCWLALASCAPIEDVVFEQQAVELEPTTLRFTEATRQVVIPLRLTRPATESVSATFEARGVEAQSNCYEPDFSPLSGVVTWQAGSDEASIELWLADDEVAETDERIELVLTSAGGVELGVTEPVTLVIEDDDRTALIDARDQFGLRPGAPEDQSAALQRALDHAGELERGVVVVAPGGYEILSAHVVPGTSLVARGATFHRPAHAPANVVTLDVHHAGPLDSPVTLVEGLTIDGRRDDQGPYRGLERQNAHLLTLWSDTLTPGRLQAQVLSSSFADGTGDGLAIGPNSDILACGLSARDLWREALSVRGGSTRLRLRGLEASATSGTSGVWIDGHAPGFQGSHTVEAELEDMTLATGDLDIEVAARSRLLIRHLNMLAPNLHILMPDSTVVIEDSTLQLGLPSGVQNHFALPSHLEVRRTTIIASEIAADPASPREATRTVGAVQLLWEAPDPAIFNPRGAAALFEDCRFARAPNYESDDTVFAFEVKEGEGGDLSVNGSTLGEGYQGWFLGACPRCEVLP